MKLNKNISKIDFNKKIYKFIYLYVYKFFFNKWFIDIIYNKIFMKFFILVSYRNVIYIDRGLIELVGPLFLVRLINFFIQDLIKLQTGFLYNYLFIFILFILFILISFFFGLYIFDSSVFFFFIFLIFYLNKNFDKNR